MRGCLDVNDAVASKKMAATCTKQGVCGCQFDMVSTMPVKLKWIDQTFKTFKHWEVESSRCSAWKREV